MDIALELVGRTNTIENAFKSLRKQGKHISSESMEDYLELLHYSAIVYCQLNWRMKEEFLEILKKFFEDKISSYQFCKVLTKKME